MSKYLLHSLLLLMLGFCAFSTKAQEMPTDSVVCRADSAAQPPQERNWWKLLKAGKLDLKDKNVEYPRFLRFCVDVYNWGDTTFNSYDEEYVQGTGRRWKAFLKNDNWFDAYSMTFTNPIMGENMKIGMFSDPCNNVGAFLQYMAVSAGYSLDMSNVIGNKPINLKKFEFSFTCARFSAELYYDQNLGGSYLRRFGDYNDGRLIKEFFPGVKMSNFGIDAYYFFNNRRYSQGAAYNFAKYQVRSQGSFILGFTYSRQKTELNFELLPQKLLDYMTFPMKKGNFIYDNYCLLIGYGYNWVFAKNFLFNVSAMPSIGLMQSDDESVQGRKTMLSMNLMGKMAVVYNVGDFFCGIQGKIDGHWYKNREYSFFNSVVNVAISAGVRF